MWGTLFEEIAGAQRDRHCTRDLSAIRWCRELPTEWRGLAIAPIRFELFRDESMIADRTLGYDQDDEACFCAFRYLLTEMLEREGEPPREAPCYAESVVSWRLRDDRWLILRRVVANFQLGAEHVFFSFGNRMPR